jgi:hypothetical protein
VTVARLVATKSALIFYQMIVFNTLKKAQHYVKHKQAKYKSYVNNSSSYYYNDEEFMYYEISKNMVLQVWGWQCGCGCDRGSTSATVIGRIKSV